MDTIDDLIGEYEPDFEMDMRYFVFHFVRSKNYKRSIRTRKHIDMMLDAFQEGLKKDDD